ncbi:MAG: hypothetical protein ACLSIR_09930 [Christensenellales bacterium]
MKPCAATARKGDALAENCARLRKSALAAVCPHQGVDRLIERIYAETGFLAQAGALPGGASRQANLHLLTTRARAFVAAQGAHCTRFCGMPSGCARAATA